MHSANHQQPVSRNTSSHQTLSTRPAAHRRGRKVHGSPVRVLLMIHQCSGHVALPALRPSLAHIVSRIVAACRRAASKPAFKAYNEHIHPSHQSIHQYINKLTTSLTPLISPILPVGWIVVEMHLRCCRLDGISPLPAVLLEVSLLLNQHQHERTFYPGLNISHRHARTQCGPKVNSHAKIKQLTDVVVKSMPLPPSTTLSPWCTSRAVGARRLLLSTSCLG